MPTTWALLALCFGLLLSTGLAQGQTKVTTAPCPKAVLLEEQTGYHCGNCPDGAAMIEVFKGLMGERFHAVSYHAGSYAIPSGDGFDLRTDHGDSLLLLFGEYGYPQGEIDRMYVPSSPSLMAIGRGVWAKAIDSRLFDTAAVNLYVSAHIDAATRELKVEVEGYYVKGGANAGAASGTGASAASAVASAAESAHYLHVALIQNHIDGPQNQAPKGYLHEHVFRDFLTPLWGDTLKAIGQGAGFSKTYTYVVPEKYRNIAADVRNLEVVVFVTATKEEVLNSSACKPTIAGLNDPPAVVLSLETLPKRYTACTFEATLESKYNDTVRQITYEAVLNGQTKTYQKDVVLPPYQKRPLTLQIDPYAPVAQNEIVFKITSLNGVAYAGKAVSAAFTEPVKVASPLIVELSTDAKPEEVYWYVADQTGKVLERFGPYTGHTEQVSVTEGLKLDTGYYSIYFCDAKWNGWLESPRGSYKIKDIDGKLAAQNYDVRGKGDVVAVYINRKSGGETSTEKSLLKAASAPKLYPNPTSDFAVLSGTAAVAGRGLWTLSDLQGRTLLGGAVLLQEGQLFEVTVSLQDLPRGLYLLEWRHAQGVHTFKVTKR